MMPLFSRYMAVDWSANNSPKSGKDSIWVAEHGTDDASILNIPTRAQAIHHVRSRLIEAVAKGERLLIGFDFAFGFPGGLAQAITGSSDWTSLWEWLADAVEDDAKNRNNRFEVGGRLNQLIGLENGPFWGHPHQHVGRYEGLLPTAPLKWPPSFPKKRYVETRQRGAKSVFQLAYTGAVGSQSLLGIAALQNLRADPNVGRHMAIWPFETRFETDLSKPVTIVEIYPSGHDIDTALHVVPDAAQVLSVTRDMAQWDRSGALPDKLAAFGLSETQRQVVLHEEGWIFGTA